MSRKAVRFLRISRMYLGRVSNLPSAVREGPGITPVLQDDTPGGELALLSPIRKTLCECNGTHAVEQ